MPLESDHRARGALLFGGCTSWQRRRLDRDSAGSVWRLRLADSHWSRIHAGSGVLMSGPAAHAVSNDDRTVAFGGYGGTISLWRDGRIDTLPSPIDREQILLDVAFSPDGRRLAAAGQTLGDSLSGNGFVVLHRPRQRSELL